MTARPLLALLLALALLLLAACGEDDESAATAPTRTPAPTATPTPTPTSTPSAADLPRVGRTLGRKPRIAEPQGDPPAELVVRDVVRGDGRAARAGDTVTVQYVGISWSTGEQFDASWDAGQPFSFPLGAQQVIPGWDEGVQGMRVGGRRELVIPPDLAYGPAGFQPAIGPNETLVFAIDLLEVE